MGLQGKRTPIERFFETQRVDGTAAAGLDVIRHVLPDRMTDIPEIDFTLRCIRDYVAAPIHPRTALTGYRHGFLPLSAAAYEFDRDGFAPYVSDLARQQYGWEINGPASAYLDDKAKFHELLEDRGFEERVPRLIGRLESGDPIGIDDGLAQLVREEGMVVVKPREGGGGNHVHVCRSDSGRILVDGHPVPEHRLETIFDEREYVVTEFCPSGSYVRSIFPDAVSTARVITMNPIEEDPFIASLSHKIGTERTAPLDTVGLGGISVHVDESGRFGTGVRYDGGRLARCTEHPDTGERIDGTVIPEWGTIREELLTFLDAVPELRYVGWDIVVSDDGRWRILEGNTNPGIEVQYHEPLLTDDRARRFYEEANFPVDASLFDRLLDRL